MAFIDYYKILGVDKNIPQKDVRAAYKKRAKQFHPDLHPNDPKAKAKFQALNEAYDVIGNPEKRKKYDQYGENWKQAEAFGGGGFGGFNGFGGGGNPFEGFDFSNFTGGGFSSFFQCSKPDASYSRPIKVRYKTLTYSSSLSFLFLNSFDKIKDSATCSGVLVPV